MGVAISTIQVVLIPILYAAQELRHGVIKLPPRPILSPDLLEAVATSTLLDFVAVRLDADKAAGLGFGIEWRLSDRDEVFAMTLAHETLTQLPGAAPGGADVTATLDRATLVGLIVGRMSVEDALASGAVTAEGDAGALVKLFGMLDDFDLQFSIVTPGD